MVAVRSGSLGGLDRRRARRPSRCRCWRRRRSPSSARRRRCRSGRRARAPCSRAAAPPAAARSGRARPAPARRRRCGSRRRRRRSATRAATRRRTGASAGTAPARQRRVGHQLVVARPAARCRPSVTLTLETRTPLPLTYEATGTPPAWRCSRRRDRGRADREHRRAGAGRRAEVEAERLLLVDARRRSPRPSGRAGCARRRGRRSGTSAGRRSSRRRAGRRTARAMPPSLMPSCELRRVDRIGRPRPAACASPPSTRRWPPAMNTPSVPSSAATRGHLDEAADLLDELVALVEQVVRRLAGAAQRGDLPLSVGDLLRQLVDLRDRRSSGRR